MSDVREILKKRPLLFDGGMGTYYKAKPGQECEQANLLDPEGVLAVHGAYLEAGADAIKTNTFGLPRMAAAGNPLWEALTDEGWRLAAQAAAKTGAAVFADLGLAPDTESLPAAQIYTALAKRFAALGAKNFLFETLSSDAGVAEAAKQIKEAVPDAFVLVSFAVLPDGYTREGRHCTQLVRSMTACGAVDAVGLNCVSAPGAMRTLVQQLGRTELPLSVMPNAGYPVVTRTRVQYRGRPEYFARELVGLAAEGVRNQLASIAQTKHRNAHREDSRVDFRSVFCINAVWTAGEDQTDRGVGTNLFHRSGSEGNDFAIDAQITDAACNQLVILTAKVQDQHVLM